MNERQAIECIIKETCDACLGSDSNEKWRCDVCGYKKAIEALEKQLNNGWIPVSEKLPEVKINPITNDYVKYNVTFKSEICGNAIYDVRQYGFGEAIGGQHWLNSGHIMDDYVTAWQEVSEPYMD